MKKFVIVLFIVIAFGIGFVAGELVNIVPFLMSANNFGPNQNNFGNYPQQYGPPGSNQYGNNSHPTSPYGPQNYPDNNNQNYYPNSGDMNGSFGVDANGSNINCSKNQDCYIVNCGSLQPTCEQGSCTCKSGGFSNTNQMSAKCADIASFLQTSGNSINPSPFSDNTIKSILETNSGSTMKGMYRYQGNGIDIIIGLKENDEACFVSYPSEFCFCG